MILYCGTLSQFVNPSWLFTVLTRVFGFEMLMIGMWIHRLYTGDDLNYAVGVGTFQAGFIIFELSNYLHTKQKL